MTTTKRGRADARTVRLACELCDRDDMDGITRAELRRAVRGGWRDVSRYQTYRESMTVYDDPADAPPGYSILDWMTHYGVCPECAPGHYGD